MEYVNANNHTKKYKNTSKYPMYKTLVYVICLNKDNIPSADQLISSSFESVILFLKEKKVTLFLLNVKKKPRN